MFRKIYLFFVFVIVAFLIFSCGEKTQSNKETIIKIAFNQSESHPQYQAIYEMGEKLKEQTKGAYSIEIHPNALLGDQRATVELVQTGAIQMSVVANSLVENFNKDFAVIGLPYIYDSVDHQRKVFTSGVLKELFESARPSGFEVLTAFTLGARSVYTTKPIEKPEDLKGLKIRVMQSDTMVKMLNYMGGVGTPMAQGEVYTAIQQKVLNGAENNEITYADLKHYEIAPIYSYTKHLIIPDLLIANIDFLSSMSKEHREILDKLIVETTSREFDLCNEAVEPAKKLAMENGAKFVEVDIKPFQDNVAPLIKEVTSSDFTRKLYDDIRALAK